MEVLPWDVWGAAPRPNEELDEDTLSFFDRIASLTRSPDESTAVTEARPPDSHWESFEELRKLYEGDNRLRVPSTVFNSLLDRHEPI